MATLAVIEERPIGNVEAEAALLGALMCDNRLIDSIADRLPAEDFCEPLHGRIYSTIVNQHSLGRPATAVTLRPFFEADQGMAEVGGPGYLATLTENRAVIIGASGFADQVREMAQRRRLIEGLRETIAAAADHGQPIEKLVEKADDVLGVARDGQEAKGEYSAADCLGLVIAGFDRPVGGVTCGNILSLDQLLGPLRPGHLVIWAGRPGMGKTATALSYALGAAAKGHGVLFVSLEMGAEELGERMAADLCFDRHRIPYEKIRDRTLTPEQQRIICRARDYLEKLPLQVVDRAGISPQQLRAIVRRWKRRFEARGHKLELVLVDYMQRMKLKGDRYEAISEISRTSKDLAKDEGLTVCALAQLSRKVEERADKRPQLSDLRDSGQIEQDADTVLFFLRQEYYLRNTEPPNDPEQRAKWEKALSDAAGRVEFICAKRRAGVTGSLMGEFLGPFQAVRG